MSLLSRKKRPLTRDAGEPRDTRLFIVGTDDTYAPAQYFGFFQLSRVKVFVVPMEGNKSSAQHALERLLKYEHHEDDELWLLLDTDHYTKGSHMEGFAKALAEARSRGVEIAVSKPCFDLWLLLHQVDEEAVASIKNCAEVGAAFRAKTGEFSKTNLKQMHYPWEAAVEAYRRAERLDAGVQGGDIPKANATRVWKLLRRIIEVSLPSQLPAPLKELRA